MKRCHMHWRKYRCTKALRHSGACTFRDRGGAEFVDHRQHILAIERLIDLGDQLTEAMPVFAKGTTKRALIDAWKDERSRR